jgi:hypothetical protein
MFPATGCSMIDGMDESKRRNARKAETCFAWLCAVIVPIAWLCDSRFPWWAALVLFANAVFQLTYGIGYRYRNDEPVDAPGRPAASRQHSY